MASTVGEIRIFAVDFAPVGWLLCDGSMVPISQYDVLYALIGTTYGGNGVTTFGLPDLRSRVPVHRGTGPGLPPVLQGQFGGVEAVSLTSSNMPPHTHSLNAVKAPATTGQPVGNMMAVTTNPVYVTNTATPPATLPPAVAMYGSSITSAGKSQPVSIIQPYTALTFIIATIGIYPTQN